MSNLVRGYTLFIEQTQTLCLPVGTDFLSVTWDFGDIILWGLINPTLEPNVDRNIVIVGTGEELPDTHPVDSYHYLGTAYASGTVAWHVFEQKNHYEEF